MVKQTPQQNVSTQERQSEYRDTHTVTLSLPPQRERDRETKRERERETKRGSDRVRERKRTTTRGRITDGDTHTHTFLSSPGVLPSFNLKFLQHRREYFPSLTVIVHSVIERQSSMRSFLFIAAFTLDTSAALNVRFGYTIAKIPAVHTRSPALTGASSSTTSHQLSRLSATSLNSTSVVSPPPPPAPPAAAPPPPLLLLLLLFLLLLLLLLNFPPHRSRHYGA